MKKFNSGITLIALIITIIVLLILAGVSINALVGENGILSQAMNASFYSEMTQVQESFELWKTQHYDDDEIPTNGIVQVSDIENNGRLYGEIAYYRRWSESSNNTQPDVDIKGDLNNIYGGDISYIPRGVEDLYYLNNSEIGIKSDKKYVIDATNSIIYAINGYTANGITVHSLPMYKAIVDGVNKLPKFASAEVSGSGNNIIYAGSKYLTDKDGHYVDENGNIVSDDEKVINPYGFTIMSNYANSNVYKLYNNGDLYAKGIKSYCLNTPKTELDKINSDVFCTYDIPTEIPGASEGLVELVTGPSYFLYIDKNKDLWSIGDNTYNIFGLSQEEQVEFSPYQIRKINLNGKKVSKVFAERFAICVVTTDGKLLLSGTNVYGELGIGSTSPNTLEFTEATFPETALNIKEFYNGSCSAADADYFNMILTTTGKLYFAGKHDSSKGGNVKLVSTTDNALTSVLNWSEVDTATMFPNMNFANVTGTGASARWHNTYYYFVEDNKCYQMTWNGNTSLINPWGECTSLKIYTGYEGCACALAVVTKEGGSIEYWYRGIREYSGIFGKTDVTENWVNFTDKFSSLGSPVVDVWMDSYTMAVKLANNKYYGIGNLEKLGKGSIEEFENWTELDSLEEFGTSFELPKEYKLFAFKYNNTKVVGIKCDKQLFGENMLEKNWQLIDTNVELFVPSNDINAYAVVKKENNIEKMYVRGKYSDYLGVNLSNSTVDTLTYVSGEGATEDVKTALASGIKKYEISNNRFYIYTKNNKLLMSCCESRNSAVIQGYNGADDLTNHPNLIEIFSDILDYYPGILIRKEDGIYIGGSNYSGNDGLGVKRGVAKAPDIWQTVGEIYNYNQLNGIWLLGENGILTQGIVRNDGWSNGKTYNIIGAGEILTTAEKMVNIASPGFAHILLSESGKLYGCGLDSRIGNGKGALGGVTKELTLVFSKEKIASITAGNGFVIATTCDGKVYGTGSNINGVLGRWRGADRTTTNSRYRTAFEWVECPELEL